MKTVVLDGYAANPGDLSWEALEQLGQCTIYDRTAPDQVLARAEGAEAILTNKTVITAQHMQALPCLRYIGVLATGYNVVNIEAARNRGIIVTNIPAYSTASVAQMVFAHLLNITQHVAHYADDNPTDGGVQAKTSAIGTHPSWNWQASALASSDWATQAWPQRA